MRDTTEFAASADLIARFWRRVNKAETCWMWLGGVQSSGYGQVKMPGGRRMSAHRFAYQAAVAPIPRGLILDHLCRVRLCVNRAHLEVVTDRTNTLRGVGPTAVNARRTHCTRGHELSEENLTHRQGRGRECRECRRLDSVARKQRQRDRIRAERLGAAS